MKVIAYHEADSDNLKVILKQGLKLTSRRGKGGEPSIEMTDQILDGLRTPDLLNTGVCRDDNIYAYVGDESYLVNIEDGQKANTEEFAKKSDNILLRLNLKPSRCYVSDLDAYDNLKRAVEAEESVRLDALARHYWASLIRLDKYEAGKIKRPEIMITYDIKPEDIATVG